MWQVFNALQAISRYLGTAILVIVILEYVLKPRRATLNKKEPIKGLAIVCPDTCKTEFLNINIFKTLQELELFIMRNKHYLHNDAYSYAYITNKQRLYYVMVSGRYTTYNSDKEPIFILEDGYGFEFVKISLHMGDSVDGKARVINALSVTHKSSVAIMARFYRDYINRNSTKDNKEYFYVYSHDDGGLYRFRTNQTITKRTSVSSCLDSMRNEFSVVSTESFASIKALHLEVEYLPVSSTEDACIKKELDTTLSSAESNRKNNYKYDVVGTISDFRIIYCNGKVYACKDGKLTAIDAIPGNTNGTISTSDGVTWAQ